jgi:predicted acetyltransferase|tara:strand:+ start:5175 stop:6461 length:1287 start_codon:yes stop_codon:yes gene_type:complete
LTWERVLEFDIRPAIEAEMGQLGLMGSYSYAGAFGDGEDNVVATGTKAEWTLCAFDDSARTDKGQATMATSFCAFPFTTRVNGKAMAMAGISTVGTRPEYRRMGLLRKIMTRAFAEQKERGQSIAGLWASQAAIYQRYGFTQAGMNRNYAVDSVDIALAMDGSNAALALPMVTRYTPVHGLDAAREVYKNFIAQRTGYLHRGKSLWLNNTLDETTPDGPVYIAIAGTLEAPLGYIVYTLRANLVDNRARSQEIKIRDFAWLDLAAYQSLWQFIGKHDLVGRVVWANAPMDDPALALFQEPRMLHSRDTEASWWRIVDAPNALAQRGYSVGEDIKIGIAGDDLAPWNNGCWHLRSEGDGTGVGFAASVQACSDAPQVTLSIKSLTAIFSGMHRAQDLANWGLLGGQASDIARLDRIMATQYAPHCPDHY